MRGSFLLSMVMALAVSACATTGSTGSATRTNELARAEIEGATSGNALDLVRQMRPAWLRSRGPNSINNNQTVTIYVDGVRFGGVRSLQSIPSMTVDRMQFLRPPEAQSRF
ncbi:MAG TPA: hypothetical protein VK966_04410, partial [Longimicrobiales bacterium]|nr:hypothetical protein [Longimicrobiales bacterium]